MNERVRVKEVAGRKGEVLLGLFPSSTELKALRIPETLVKVENRSDPVLLANDDYGRVLRIESKSLLNFFNRVRSIQLMTAFISPSPFQLPKFVFHSEDRVTYCFEQCEVLRLIETHPKEFTVQRFIQPRDEHARKFRGKWENAMLTVTLITRLSKIPFNNPVMRPVIHKRNASLANIKRKEQEKPVKVDNIRPVSYHCRRKTFSNLRKFQHLAVEKGLVTPYTASFTCPDDCFLEPVQRQEIDEFMLEVVRVVEKAAATLGHELQSLEMDVIQDHLCKLHLLSLKHYSFIPTEDLLRSKFGHMSTASPSKSPMCRTLESLKSCVESPMRMSMNRANFIDLSDIQDKNIDFYGKFNAWMRR